MSGFLDGWSDAEGSDSEFVRTYDLDEVDWQAAWDRIYIDPQAKKKLLHFGLLEPTLHVEDLDRMTLNRHGAILLAGPPGTGKTTLARGAAHELADRLDLDELGVERAVFKQVQMRHLFSKSHGDSPKLVKQVFEGVQEQAEQGDVYQVVLLDEVESLFSNRRLLTDTDPMDAIRAVNMALDSLDRLAEVDNVYVIATSNQPDAVDGAFVDRTDEQIHVGMPAAEQRRRILADVVEHLNRAFDADLAPSKAQVDELVDRSAGLSGRRLRKTALAALAREPETVEDPGRLTVETLLAELADQRREAVSAAEEGPARTSADGDEAGRPRARD